MTVDTFYASTTNSGLLDSTSATYSTAITGGGTVYLYAPSAVTAFSSGQAKIAGNYFVDEMFLEFNTSSIPDNASISSVSLKLKNYYISGSPTGTVEAFAVTYGTISTANFIPNYSIGSYTLVASILISSITSGAVNTLTPNGSNLIGSVNKTGMTQFLICTDTVRLGSPTPTGQDIVYWDDPDDSNVGDRPVLEVTYTVPTNQSVSGSPGTFAGIVNKRTSKSISGAVSSLTGFLGKRIPIRLSGVSGGISSTINSLKAFTVAINGTTGAISGSISRKTYKALTGIPVLSGILTKQGAPLRLSGVVGVISGNLLPSRLLYIAVSGALTMTGALTTFFNKYRFAVMRAGHVIINKMKGGSVN